MQEITLREAELVNKARSGDTGSFSALVEMYQERAVHIAYSFVGNFEDARDIAQEAFVKAYEKLSHFKEESRFYTWFYRILANACKDFLRKKKIRKHLSFWFGRDGDEEPDPVMELPAWTLNASEELMNEELGAEIGKALEKLPFQQRSVFTLRYLEGFSIEEIADTLTISQGAVKATLWQAGHKMKKNLGLFLQYEEGA